MPDRTDILIVGGGLIGLAIARTLRLRGASVTVFDRDPEPRGASWAAGGMLAPLGEAPDPGPFLAFGLDALARWPRWAASLEAESALDVGLHAGGKLLVADTAEAVQSLHARYAWQAAAGHDVVWLDAPAVRRVEPALDSGWSAGLHLPDHAHVDPRRLLAALLSAARAAGVHLRYGTEVRGLDRGPEGLRGLLLADGSRVPAGWVVNAAGAWSGRIEGLPAPLPVRPVRGQMLALALDEPLTTGLVAGPAAYLIPREVDGRPTLVVGASMDDAGFEVATDAATIAGLRAGAEALVPALRGRPELDRWAGLRPGTPDDLPILGVDPRLPRLVHATGHHRNGILLAPSTAAAVAEVVEGGAIDPRWADAFNPGRFDGA